MYCSPVGVEYFVHLFSKLRWCEFILIGWILSVVMYVNAKEKIKHSSVCVSGLHIYADITANLSYAVFSFLFV